MNAAYLCQIRFKVNKSLFVKEKKTDGFLANDALMYRGANSLQIICLLKEIMMICFLIDMSFGKHPENFSHKTREVLR